MARRISGTLLGIVVGTLWGEQLSGGSHWPKLLWVSLGLAGAAFVLAVGRPDESLPTRPGRWRDALELPWRWSRRRLLDFSLINVGVTVGLLASFRPGA